MQRRTFIAASLSLLPLAARAQNKPIVVGSKNFTEQLLLAAMTDKYLTAKGFQVDLRTGLGSVALRQAQEAGQIDLVWEYTGTSLITFNKVTEKLDPAATYARVKELDGARGLVWLDPSRANNTYALGMRRADATARGIASLSDLAAKINGGTVLKFASNSEFYSRPDGLTPLQQAYSFQFGRENVIRMDTGLVYQAVRDQQADVGIMTATDGRVPAFDFVILKDDRNFFPYYALTPVVRKPVLDTYPDLAALMNAVSAKLDDTVMSRLNSSVDVGKRTVEDVAGAFLKDEHLV